MANAVSAVRPLGNAAKVLSLGIGAGIGLGLNAWGRANLPDPKLTEQLDARGISTLSHREATATFAPMAFVAAAAIGAGIGKRSETAAITTASLGAAAMLASTATSTMVRADDKTAGAYLRTLGIMTTVGAAAYAIGAVDEVPINASKRIGLGLLGVAVGAILPETMEYLGSLPAEFRRSMHHADAG